MEIKKWYFVAKVKIVTNQKNDYFLISGLLENDGKLFPINKVAGYVITELYNANIGLEATTTIFPYIINQCQVDNNLQNTYLRYCDRIHI